MTSNSFSLEQSTAQQGMFSISDIVMSEEKKRKDAYTVSMMRSYNNQTNPVEEYQSVLSAIDSGISVEDLREQEQNAYLGRVEDELREYIVDNISNPDPNVQASLQNIMSGFTDVRDSYMDEFDGAEQVFANMYKDETLDDYRTRQQAAYATTIRHLDEEFDDRGWGSTAFNFVAQMLAPDDLKDFNDYAKLIGTDFKGLMEEISDFQTRDPEDQLAIMQVRMPAMLEALDNNPFAIRQLVDLYHSDHIIQDVALAGTFDALAFAEVGIIAKGLVTLGSKTAAAQSAAKQLKDLDNFELSARTNSLAGADTTDEAARAIGTTRTDAATTAHPAAMETVPVVSGQMDDVAAAVQEARKSTISTLWQDLLPVASAKVSRGQMKQWQSAKRELVGQISKLKQSPILKTRPHSQQSKALKERIRLLETQQGKIQKFIDGSFAPEQAFADLSRLEQGIIPTRFASVYQRNVQQELAKAAKPGDVLSRETMQAEGKAAKAGDELAATDEIVELGSSPRMLDNPQEFGLSEDFAQLLRDSVREPVRALVKGAQQEALQPLSPEQLASVQARVTDNIKKHVADSGQNVNRLDIVADNDLGFTVKYTTDDGLESSYTHQFQVSDSGSLVSDPKLAKSNVPGALRKVFSPDVVWREMMGGFVKDVTFAGQQTSRIANNLMRKWQDIEKGIGRESRVHVDALLQAGDELGTVFTPRELLDGMIEVRIGQQGFKRQYSKQEVVHYFQKRAFFDELHAVRNTLTREQLGFLDFKSIKYTDAEGVGQSLVGKVHQNLVGVDRAALNDGFVFIPDNVGTGKATFPKGRSVVQPMLEQDYKLVKLLDPIRFKKSNKKVEWALVRNDNVSQLPSQVLNYTAGYVPRIYKPGYFFVKDTDSVNRETLQAFEKKVDADKFADALRADGQNVTVRQDREFSDLERLLHSADMYGGLYTGPRKSTPLMVQKADGSVDRLERLSTAQATQRYIQSVSDIMPINTYRMSMVERWMNTVNDLAKLQGRQGIDKRAGIDAPIDLEPGSRKMMEDARDYLKRTLSIPSDEESHFRNSMMRIGELMRGKPGGDWVLNNIHADPVRAMKGLTFNAHMGWFNVRQLFVQAQNSAIALSIHPTKAPKALYKTMAMRSAVYSNNPEVWRRVARTAKIDADEFVEDIRRFKASGLLDSIARTADFDSNLDGLGTGTFETLRKAAKHGRIFYEEGETFSRLMAWNIAKSNLQDQGVKLTTRSLSDETVRLHMNLQAENAAHWQNNVLAIPLQFTQVFAKFAENMLPTAMGGTGKWTAAERTKVLAGQLALYGTVGVPIAEDVAAYVADLSGTDPVALQRENPMLLEGVEEGLVGVFTDLLGFDNNFSESGSIIAGMDDNVLSDLMGGFADYLNGDTVNANAFDIGFGASGNTIKRTVDAAQTAWQGVNNVLMSPSPATVGQQAVEVLQGMASITSTWNNARKAMYAQHYGHGLRSNRGVLMMTADELGADWPTQMAKAMGFPTDRESAMWRAYEYDMDSKQARQQTTKALREAHLEWLRTGDTDLYRKRKSLLLGVHNATTRMDIKTAFDREVLQGKSKFSKQVQQQTIEMIKNNGQQPMPLSFGTTLEEEQ